MAVLIAAIALLLALVPHSRTAVARALLPGLSISYTGFHILPGNTQAAENASVSIHALMQGRFLDRAQIEWRTPDQEWNVAAIAPDDRGHVNFEFRAELPEMEYRLTAGPSRSPSFHVDVYAPAKVESLEWMVHPPRYTARDPFNVPGRNLSVLRSSEVRLAARFSQPVREASFRFDDQSTIPLRKADSALEWSLDLGLNAHGDAVERLYWIDFVDQHGRSGSTQEPGRLRINPDQPPRVDIHEPGMDGPNHPINPESKSSWRMITV
jgi:hypothetical protein